MAESLIIGLTLVTMIGVLLVALLPFVPGPLLMWLVALIFGLIDQFDRLPLLIFAVMTAFMLLGMTTDIWLTWLGIKSSGASCWSGVGTILGGIIGTFFIPVPLCGTFIGATVGALGFELLRARSLREAMIASQAAATTFVYGFLFEIVATVVIFLLFLVSLYLTG